ncbi:MAG: polysaccharide deacetylase family protein [Roseobacter sp.]
MKTDWAPLRNGLKHFRRSGLTLPLWWRDDDAISATPALDRLSALSEQLEVPVHIAVIPARADHSLVRHVTDYTALIPLVHGWRHVNHAPPEQKKAEFNSKRADGQAEIQHALTRMKALFADRLVPLFVPPWNRIDADHTRSLADVGYRGLSTFAPRTTRCAAPGLVQINTHIDPIDWRGTRDLNDPQRIITDVLDLLQARENGDADAQEPMGYLTHHLVHSAPLWDFSHDLLSELRDGGADVVSLTPLLEHSDEPT